MSELFLLIGPCWLAPCIVALFGSGKWKDWRAVAFVLAATAALTLNFLALNLMPELVPSTPWLDALRWNWIGKIGGIAITLVVYALLSADFEDGGRAVRPSATTGVAVSCSRFAGSHHTILWCELVLRHPATADGRSAQPIRHRCQGWTRKQVSGGCCWRCWSAQWGNHTVSQGSTSAGERSRSLLLFWVGACRRSGVDAAR